MPICKLNFTFLDTQKSHGFFIYLFPDFSSCLSLQQCALSNVLLLLKFRWKNSLEEAGGAGP
jgi:hypothetical protein